MSFKQTISKIFYCSFMKQRKLNDSAVSKTLPEIPDAPPPDPGEVVIILCVTAVEVFVFAVIVDFVVIVDFALSAVVFVVGAAAAAD